MRRIFSVLFAVVLLFNFMLFSVEAADYGDGEAILAFYTKPEFGSESIKLKFSDIPETSGLDVAYNPDTGFISAAGGGAGIFLKVMDDQVEVTEEALTINRTGLPDMYFSHSFKAFAYISGSGAELQNSAAMLAEVKAEFFNGKAYVSLRSIGTSSFLDSGNINQHLKSNMLLVNKSNALDKTYIPKDLIYSAPSRGRATINVRLDREAMAQLNYMLDAAYKDGVTGMVITSAYRNFEKQTSLYINKTNTLARSMSRKAAMEEASKVVAIPGTSEHQTGLAVDIYSEGTGLVKSFGSTKQGKWLKENSWKYGYIIRYPQEKTHITGIIYEPWHIRYVGGVHAELLYKSGMCLEEYVEYLKQNRIISYTDSSGSEYAIQYINKQEFDMAGLRVSLPEASSWSISECTRDSYILTIKL